LVFLMELGGFVFLSLLLLFGSLTVRLFFATGVFSFAFLDAKDDATLLARATGLDGAGAFLVVDEEATVEVDVTAVVLTSACWAAKEEAAFGTAAVGRAAGATTGAEAFLAVVAARFAAAFAAAVEGAGCDSLGGRTAIVLTATFWVATPEEVTVGPTKAGALTCWAAKEKAAVGAGAFLAFEVDARFAAAFTLAATLEEGAGGNCLGGATTVAVFVVVVVGDGDVTFGVKKDFPTVATLAVDGGTTAAAAAAATGGNVATATARGGMVVLGVAVVVVVVAAWPSCANEETGVVFGTDGGAPVEGAMLCKSVACCCCCCCC
jgi:hypothetical protein